MDSVVKEKTDAIDNQGFRNGNNRLVYMLDALNYQGMSTKFDTAENPEADGVYL
jgi:hypothetical protein